jgi:cell wall-associated NlpC family hydrolase
MTACTSVRRGAAAGIFFLLVAFVPRPAAASPIDAKRAEASQLEAKIEALGSRESALAEQYNGARLAAQRVDNQVADAKNRLAALEAKTTAARAQLTDVAVNAYMRGGTAGAMPALAGGPDADPSIAKVYVGIDASHRTEALDEYRASGLALREQQAQLNVAQKNARAAANQIAQRRSAVVKAQADLDAELGKVKGDLATLVAQAEASRRAADAARARRIVASSPRGGFGAAPARRPTAQAAVNQALAQVGKPYQWGAAGPDSFDCSGLTLYAWRAGGVSLSHYTGAQYGETTHISMADLEPGDLVFNSSMGHVAMYIGGGNIVEAPHSGLDVRVTGMRSEFTLASRP